MQIDTQHKKNFILDYIKALKKHQELRIFAHYNPLVYGFFDSQFITKTSILSLDSVQQILKTKNKMPFTQFQSILKNVFIGISKYLFDDDPLQILCEIGLGQVQNLEEQFRYKFYSEKGCNEKLKLFQQLQMVNYLQKYKYNEQILRQIGQHCNILTELHDQLIFDLGANRNWEFITKKN